MTRAPQSKPILIGLLAALLSLLGIRDVRCSADNNLDAWMDLKAGMFIHFNMSTFTGKSWSTGEEDPSLFNPTDLDVGSWAKAAKTGGLKYGVLTVKHHDGFALWNTKLNDHDVAQSPYRKDIVKEFADAFRASKLKVGLYYSIWDRRWDRDPSIDQVEAIKAQLMELLGGKYGRIDLLWLDGWGWQKKYSDIPYDEIREYIRKISPGTVVANNDHENSLTTTDLLIWETAVKMPIPVASPGPFEVAEQIGRTWFFREGKKSENKPREYFHWLVNKVVPEGGIVTFNVGPDKTGAIPKERTSALKHINEVLKLGPILNWADGATVSQSSTANGNGPAIATNGKVFSLVSGSVTNTNTELEAWWEADLGTVCDIGEIRVWNRLKNGKDRLADFHVFVSSKPFTSSRVAKTITQEGVHSYYHEGVGEWTTRVNHQGQGRYVRIQLTGEEALSLAEVEILDNPDKWAKPIISSHPSYQNTATGGDATFTVQASGQPSPTYIWQKQDNRKWKDIAGGTSSTLTISGTKLADATNYRVVVSNNAGEVNSKTARLKVLVPPAIIAQPTDMLFASGSNARIELKATGSKTLRYQWFKNGVKIPKATKNKVTLKKVIAAKDNGTYQVEVENGVGKVTSDEFLVSIISAVEVTADPKDAAFIQGQPGTLSITATGDGTLAYQWEKLDPKSRKWSAVEGATSPTLTIDDVQPEQLGDYRCMVDNGASRDYSKGGDLGMYIVPTFKTQPRSYSLNEGRKVTLKAMANGDPTPTYQWEKLNGDGVTWDPIPKGTKAQLKFSKIKTENAGKYRVNAINGGGSATSDEVDLVVYHAPRIGTQPVTAPVNEGNSINLGVTVDSLDSKGTTSTYTWYNGKKAIKDGEGISGASTADLDIANASVENAGSYYCSVKNSVGTVKSRSAKIAVMLKPYPNKQMKNRNLPEGKTATFSASFQGGKPMTFKWQKDDVDIPGETKNKLAIRGIDSSRAGTYRIIASNGAGSDFLEAELTVVAKAVSTPGVDVQQQDLLSAIADSDSDGLSNLLEHALGSDPARNDSTYSPIVYTVEDGSGQKYVSFSYSENKSATGVTYIVERSADLKTWEPVDLSSASVNRLDRDTFTEVTIFIPASEGSGFFRVRVD